jgi:hypothetical protein
MPKMVPPATEVVSVKILPACNSQMVNLEYEVGLAVW